MLYLISLLSLLLPTQLGFHFNNFDSTVYGFRIDYLIPTVYLSDIVAFAIILFGLFSLKIKKSHLFYALIFVCYALLNVYISDNHISSIYKWLKVFEMSLLAVVIANTKKIDVFKHFIKPLSYSVLIVCLLGIAQYINKSSIGGLFYLLGERSFLFSDPNIAPYPYSTFSHPNSFAGFLLVFGLLLMQYRKKFEKKYFWIVLLLVIVNFILTNSLNVYITMGILLMLKISSNLLFGIFTIDLTQRFVTHRLELIQSSWQMIKENFLFGVGLNNFIPNLVKVSRSFVNAWELQPVHNIFLLIVSETGIFGLLIFLSLFLNISIFSNFPLIAILFSGLNDHYWLTLQQNILLFTYVLAFTKQSIPLQSKLKQSKLATSY